ncbi:MAG: tRNA (N(6)-L-threonylcarbamoyladenosine(37)-C(2))-methylthiotransferase MtaB [Thermodesulfovibrionales bacterium]|nr:tRNA (N(6)-L-threonylcarbamoyladenosine(37)-C(2))-methylthiotransferase MtaB [Thermodesulfovibrionales bacterium]
MKITVLTLGCKTNQAESFSMEHSLNNSGHQIVDISENADVCIINTCTVTAKADYQSRQLIRKALRNNSKVIVTGCYAELNHDHLKQISADIQIIRNTEKDKIINMFTSKPSSNNKSSFNPRYRPFVKVQDGCNFSCTYCAIPLARGRSRSVEVNEVIEKVKFYESTGYNEIVLTGIHLGTYGLDLIPKRLLSGLVENILKNTKIPRIRISSLEINEIDEQLLELITGERVCKHIHVPIQSGDDKILKLMNRSYSVSEFTSRIMNILKKLPNISIGTDVIVGFPGEGENEFNNTKELISFLPFSHLHVFPYSSRPKTKAITFSSQVSERDKKERAFTLRSIGMLKKSEYIQNNIGQTLDVIIESRSEAGIIGTAGNYIKVLLDSEHELNEGMLASIQLSEYHNGMALGIPLNTT